MKQIMLTIATASGILILAPHRAHAITCANGIYRAGCVGPNGAAVVPKAPYAAAPHGYYARPYYAPRPSAACASGPYRAGCVGPNGAAVVRRPY